MTDSYHGRSNWKASDMEDPAEWMIQLSAAQIADLDQALRAAKLAEISIDKLTRDDFALPSFSELVPEIHDRLENGRGVVVLRGLPAEKYPRADLRLMYWGLGLHLGTAVSQSSKGDLLGDVRNFGSDPFSSRGRGYMSKQGLGFHSDLCDVVVLMVMRAAKSGGRSMIASSVAIRNEIAATRPDLLDALYQPFYWSWKGQEAPGELPYYQQPIFMEHEGKFSSCHVWSHVLAAYEDFGHLPRMSPQQAEAERLIRKTVNDPSFHFGMLFEPGDIQLLNNHVTYHARTDFEDFEEEDRKRHLLRMWLSVPNSRPLSPWMAAMFKQTSGGAIRGGFPSRTGAHGYETIAALE